MTPQEIYKQRIEEAAEFDSEHAGMLADAFESGANFILSHQWISVEEALPEFKGNFSDYYIIRTESGWCAVTMYYRTSEKEYWWNFENVNAKVTHWMPIPQLKGGKE